MKILKVKYCYSEEELNEFLYKLPFLPVEDGDKTKEVSFLYRITYMPAPAGVGTSKKVDYKTGIVAIVEYWYII